MTHRGQANLGMVLVNIQQRCCSLLIALFANSNIETFHKTSTVFVAPLHATPNTDRSGRNDLLNGNLHVLCQQNTRSVFLPSCTQDKSDERIQETLLVGYECKGWYNMYITKSSLVPGTDRVPGIH